MQKNIFINNEGNMWFKRNINHVIKYDIKKDIIINYIKNQNIDLNGKKILEIGCSNGYRLNYLKNEFDCECYGIEPSLDAVNFCKENFSGVNIKQGCSIDIDYQEKFDFVFIGFCLYLVDRDDLFQTVNLINKVLNTNGIVINLDFIGNKIYKNKYKHCDSIYCYKMNYTNLFTSNPQYIEIFKKIYHHEKCNNSTYNISDLDNLDDLIEISVIKKFNEESVY